MTKKIISQLVEASYTKGQLDNKKVERVAKLLTRADLKKYIRGLKLVEKANTISLVLPDSKLYNKSLLGNVKKQVKVLEDKSLLLGIKVIDNDTVYDMSLKSNIERFIQSL
ncbi:MAG TPA: hypothetical protein VEW42_05090 [Candidatus Eisenbacteria bacterium]|nr:hypothetical protein [Candidatus Eisenbacteria bacterium]